MPPDARWRPSPAELRRLELALVEAIDWAAFVDLDALHAAHARLGGRGAARVLAELLDVVQEQQRFVMVDAPCAPCAEWLDSLVANAVAPPAAA